MVSQAVISLSQPTVSHKMELPKVPSTVFSGYSSTEPALTPLSIESDATGSNGMIAYVEVKLDGQDISGNDI